MDDDSQLTCRCRIMWSSLDDIIKMLFMMMVLEEYSIGISIDIITMNGLQIQ